MPLVDNKLPVLFGKLMRPRQLAHSQTQRLAKLDSIFYNKDGFPAPIANMNMNGPMSLL